MVETNQLQDANNMVSLAISLNSGVTRMAKLPGPKFRAIAAKVVDIKAMV